MRFTLTLLVFLGLIVNAAAQGTLQGKITDEKTGEALVGVTISVPSLTNVAEFSDEDGSFLLKVPAGTYAVQIRYMGYVTKEVSDVKIENGTVTPLNVAIKQESKINTLRDVVVRSTIKKESLNALYIAQKNSASVSDGISAEAIKKSPDKSTGEVLKRVSGTTIQDNKFVIIRGLSDRYNTGLIDNAFLPSTEANRKAFSFDIIPSSLIDNIIITKSGTPDLPGDFAGGVINILTKEIPDKNFNTVSIGASYNTVSTFKDYKTGYKSSTDILGFDNGARKLPSSIPPSDDLAGRNTTEAESKQYLSALNNNYAVTNRKALPAMSLQASMGRLYNLKKNARIGFTSAINYGHSETVKQNVERIYGNYNVIDNVYQYNTTVGALANIAYSNANTKIALKNIYNRTFDDNFLYRTGEDGGSSISDMKYYAFDLLQKSMFKSSLEGEHSIGKDAQRKFNWVVSFNNVTNSQPDQRKVQYVYQPVSDNYQANISSLTKFNNRLWGSLNERILNSGVNYTTPYKVGFLYKSSLKVGALALYRNRDFSNRYLGATSNYAYTGNIEPALSQPVENLYNTTSINDGVFSFQDQTGASDKYTATAFTKSAYAMSDNRITTNLRVVWGVRFESYALDLKSTALTNGSVNPTWNDVLPSLNSSYALSEKSNLRMSYFRSVARPELREIAPMSYYDYELNQTITGREDLNRSRINNLDLRYEVFPNPGEVISASVFYKGFDRTIENRLYGTGSSTEISPINYGKATNVGAEFEIRKALDFIAPSSNVFKNLTFYTNVSIIKSQVNLDKSDDQRYLDKPEFARTSRQMAGQAPYVINASLNYAAPSGKFGLSLLYNRLGQRVYIVGGEGQYGDVFERSRNVLDGQISYNVGKRSEFRLNVKDILNAQYFFFYDQNANKKWDEHTFEKGVFDPTKDYIFQRYRLGQTFSLTYTYRF